jgi:hypothetical protein
VLRALALTATVLFPMCKSGRVVKTNSSVSSIAWVLTLFHAMDFFEGLVKAADPFSQKKALNTYSEIY